MTESEVSGALREAVWLMLLIGGPVLLLTLVAGLIVSLLQAVTQISEPTLVFAPKVIVVVATLTILGPYMQSHLSDFTRSMMDRLITVGGQ